MFYGSIVALITPFSDKGVDEQALVNLIRLQLDSGTDGIVPVGTTGEAPTLTAREQRKVMELVVQEVAGQVPVIAGAGSNNPVEAVAHAADAAAVGAVAALHALGYYNRPNQEGIYRHFETLNQSTELPIIAYNVPPRSVIDIEPETMARLAELDHVIGVKDATCDLSRPVRERLMIDKPFCFLSGEDPTAVAYNAHGGQGCISVTANVAPALCAQMQQACAAGNYGSALEIQRRLMPLHLALFLEPSPAGVKYACSLLGQCESTCRQPMVELTHATKMEIERVMRELELI
ncbi:MAG: 4-hydroxy-tetrahydrodipicolinate synthase [Rhizobiaceae bacterium]